MNFVLSVRNYQNSEYPPERNFLPEFLKEKINMSLRRKSDEGDQSRVYENMKEFSNSQALPTSEAPIERP